jgi:Na+-translocating ferredoxin:NAD+ oxidoreductase RnfD subunit
MSETVSAKPAASAAQPAVKEQRKPRFDQRYLAPLFITCILIGAHFSVGVLESPLKTLLAIVTAILCDAVLGRVFYGKVPHLASAYISGISVGILVRSPFFWPYALCSAITITSKYVLRVKGRHIWNPSNFGIVAMLFLAKDAVASLSIQFGNSIGPMIVIWILGSIIISRLRRLHICATYVASFLLFSVVRAGFTGHPLAAELAPITGPMYQLFIFFMITDPKTTVSSKKGQIATAFCIALVEALFRLCDYWRFHLIGPSSSWAASPWLMLLSVDAPYLALFVVGPIANLIEIGWKSRHPGAAKPAPAAA